VTLTLTVLFNHAYNLFFSVLIAISILPPYLPNRWKPYVGIASSLAMWIKSHRNLYFNPDGTPAQANWPPEATKPTKV